MIIAQTTLCVVTNKYKSVVTFTCKRQMRGCMNSVLKHLARPGLALNNELN